MHLQFCQWNCLIFIMLAMGKCLCCLTLMLGQMHPSLTRSLAMLYLQWNPNFLNSVPFLYLFIVIGRSTRNRSHCCNMYTFLCVMFGSMAMLVKEHGITVFGVCVIYDCLVIHKRFIWR